MKNIKLSVKLIGGFIVSAIITLIVGLVGYIQLTSLSSHVDMLGKEDLPKVISILQMESHLNGLLIGMRTLMSPMIDKETRMAQYNVLTENRAMYRNYFDEYSRYNQSPEEKELSQKFVTEVGVWAKSNNQAIETSEQLIKTDILEPEVYMKNLWMFTSDHYKLAANVGELLASGKEFEGGTDPTACRFGTWLGSYTTSNSDIGDILRDVKAPHNHFHESIEKIKNTVREGQAVNGIMVYRDELIPAAEDVFGHFEKLREAANSSVELFAEMSRILMTDSVEGQKKTMAVIDQLLDLNLEESNQAVLTAERGTVNGKLLVIIGILIGVIVALVLGVLLTRGITRPMFKGVAFARELAKGNFSEQLNIDRKDEVGDLAVAMKNMANELNSAIKDINSVMYAVKEGDLSRSVTTELSGDLNILKESINESIAMLGHTIMQVVNNTDQVQSGSTEISSASQSLATGTSEQAASLEEISSTMSEVGSRAKTNNDNATHAARLTTQAMEIAARGNEQMDGMLSAMDKINSSSTDISKIIKVIDDIAFQTNLLALNAAVEAARAGSYGKGFAVVADEVRNLAARSAEAAKNTTELIEHSIKEVDSGVANAGKTAEVLKQISEAITKVNDLVSEIAAASLEQSNNTEEINTALTQVNNVVQQNSSISEEAASSSEELSSQAMELRALTRRFKVAGSGEEHHMMSISQPETEPITRLETERKPTTKLITLDEDNF